MNFERLHLSHRMVRVCGAPAVILGLWVGVWIVAGVGMPRTVGRLHDPMFVAAEISLSVSGTGIDLIGEYTYENPLDRPIVTLLYTPLPSPMPSWALLETVDGASASIPHAWLGDSLYWMLLMAPGTRIGGPRVAQRILVIEDEPAIADNITYALSTEGFSPHWCRSGGEARRALDEMSVSLIVLDIGLPDIDGFELARELRRSDDTPIIFVTARSQEIDRVVGLEIGADDYVVKPFSPRELAARVKAVLRRTRAGPAAAREAPAAVASVPQERAYGPFVLDESRRRITYFDEHVVLSRYEFRLLAVLVRSPGQVFSRGQLMDLVWEEPDASLERTVDTHMKILRRKLRAIRPEDEPIVTHRGTGYALKEYR